MHRRHLAVHDVRIPETEYYSDHNKAVWLAALWYWRDREVHKDEISAIVRRDVAGAGADQQVRHLKRDGWNIGTKPGVHKLDPFRPSAEFQNTHARRRQRLSATGFDGIKQAFGFRCATCGAVEGEPDPRYGANKVHLQQGHRDPNAAGDETDNIIPQCQFCNRSYRDDFVFDEKGRARAVAGTGPVQRASKAVQKLILDWLVQRGSKKR